MEVITSKDNRTLKYAMSLKQRKQRNKHKEFLVEGLRAVRDMVVRDRLRTLLIKESLIHSPEVEELMAMDKLIIAFSVRDDLYTPLEDTVNGQGVMGIARQGQPNFSAFQAQDGLYVLLDGVQDPGNMGTLIRTAVAAGVKALFVSKGSVDVYNEKTIRSALSAIGELTIYTGLDDQDIENLILHKNLRAYVTTLEDAKNYSAVTYDAKTLLVLGNEGQGVRGSIQALCQERIHIPLYGPIESLNVGIAGALAMYKVREEWTK